ncbi:MFS general substrate transporter [Ramicandelaber brevisporus]|nr:MFS general substrate transporter [Ramicandelaber brevisporus]
MDKQIEKGPPEDPQNSDFKEFEVEDATTATPATPAPAVVQIELTRVRLIAIFSGLFLAMFLAALDLTIISTALPAIGSDLNALTDLTWVAVAYMLTNTALQPLYGKFSDIFGRQALLLFAIIVFIGGSALCGWANSMIMLIIGRGVAGIGGAGIMSLILIVIIGLYCGGVVLVLIFIFVEIKYAAEPIIPMRLFRVRNVALAYISVLCLGATLMGVIFFMPIYFTVVRGYTPTKSGLGLLPVMLSLVGAAGITGVLVEKFGRYRRFIWFGQLLAIAGLAMLHKLDHTTKGVYTTFALILYGFGAGCCMQNMILVCQASVSEDDMALVSGLYNFFQTIGGVIGLAIMSAVQSGIRDDKLKQIVSKMENPAMILEAVNKLETINGLSEPYRSQVQDAFTSGITSAMLVAIPFACIGFLASVGFQHKSLRKGPGHLAVG